MTKGGDWSVRRPAAIGAAALFVLVAFLGGWSARTEIAGAVIASGSVVVENHRHIVQHREGGTVGAVLIRDGDAVAAGDVLIRLDAGVLEAERALIVRQIVEIGARRARLEAERLDRDDLVLTDDIRFGDRADVQRQIEGQRALLVARRMTRDRELEQIDERILQARNQIAGLVAQVHALKGQAVLVGQDLTDGEALLSRGLVQRARVNQLRGQALQIAGNIGKLEADIAQRRGEIAAFEIEKLRLTATRREEAIATFRDLSLREAELETARIELDQRLARMDIRAPASGVVHGATVFNAGAVVRAAEPLMYVVPQDEPLIIHARVATTDVDQVFVGQSASLRFPGFNTRTSPEISGVTLSVSADAFTDEASGQSYYVVEVAPDTLDAVNLGGMSLLPGMPVEAYLKTENRTPLSYLAKPLVDYFNRALRES